VQLVEDHDGRLRAEAVQAEPDGERRGTPKEFTTVVGVVPVEIVVCECPARGGLTDLTRAGDERHLTVSVQVVAEDGGVEARPIRHGTIIAIIVR
jgi:hypothetical protein